MKVNIVLVHIGYEKKPDMEMGVREFKDFSEVEKLARHWCESHGYDTWKMGSLEEKVITKKPVRTKRSKKS